MTLTLNNFKNIMIEKAKKRGGVWENFGATELQQLRDQYLDLSDYSPKMNAIRDKINKLDIWASTFYLD